MLRRLIGDLLAPRDPQTLAARALAAYEAGDAAGALRHARRALRLDPALDDMHIAMSRIAMPGEHYTELLERIHEHFRPRTYVEIGVFQGESLRLARPDTAAIGVDPAPALAAPLPPNTRVFPETSDDFFARHDVRAELGGRPVDLAFIDGMHHFEFALRDFINLEPLCEPGSAVLLHDCYPCNEIVARRERASNFWTGDVWRVVPLLRKHRPDLDARTIATWPSGLCLVRNLDPSSTFLRENLERLCAEGAALGYEALEKDPAGTLNVVPNDWERIRPLLQRSW